MEPVVGIFRNRESARRAAADLHSAGVPAARINLLLPGDAGSLEAAESVPTSDTEQPGMGKAVGGVVGGVAGATVGMGLGAAVATLLVPGIGPVAAVGLAAAALLGIGGAVGGAAAGGALEDAMSHGLPKDELYLYEDALRKGHSVVFVMAEDDAQAKTARARLASDSAETIDAARDAWWIGLRDSEAELYERDGGRFDEDEPLYRRGFEAAQHPDRRDRTWDEAKPDLEQCFGDDCARAPFRRGFERGSEHLRDVRKSFEESPTIEFSTRR